ncbi:hypothetical protein B0H10DRAFT_2028403, partial [Mycena sp. CBHHK59/15]
NLRGTFALLIIIAIAFRLPHALWSSCERYIGITGRLTRTRMRLPSFCSLFCSLLRCCHLSRCPSLIVLLYGRLIVIRSKQVIAM